MSEQQLTFRVVEYGSSDYDKMVALRNTVLRIPLGRNLSAEELALDVELVHLAALDVQGEVLGTVMLQRLSDTQVRMRQVCVREDMQGTGVGKKLMVFAEEESLKAGYSSALLHSRDNAVMFYNRLGYVVEGEFFEESGIPHITMTKQFEA